MGIQILLTWFTKHFLQALNLGGYYPGKPRITPPSFTKPQQVTINDYRNYGLEETVFIHFTSLIS